MLNFCDSFVCKVFHHQFVEIKKVKHAVLLWGIGRVLIFLSMAVEPVGG